MVVGPAWDRTGLDSRYVGPTYSFCCSLQLVVPGPWCLAHGAGHTSVMGAAEISVDFLGRRQISFVRTSRDGACASEDWGSPSHLSANQQSLLCPSGNVPSPASLARKHHNYKCHMCSWCSKRNKPPSFDFHSHF